MLSAHQVAGAAQLQVNVGNFETIVGSHHCFQAGTGIFAQLKARHQNAVTLVGPAPHAPAQLVQLREAEPLGALNHHHRGIGYVHAHFDYSGGHHNLGFSFDKALHLEVLFLGFHAPVHDADLELREGPRHALVAVGQVFVVHCFRLLNQRVHDVHLPSQCHLCPNKLEHFQAVGIVAMHCNDGFAAGGQLINHAHVEVAI